MIKILIVIPIVILYHVINYHIDRYNFKLAIEEKKEETKVLKDKIKRNKENHGN